MTEMVIENAVLRAAAIVTALGVLGGVLVWAFKMVKAFSDGIKCMLRAAMLHTYYNHNGEDRLRQWEAENFELEYKAYKALGGNSFVDNLHEEVKTWDVKR